MNIAVGDETGRLIPYQDHPVTGPTYDKYYLSTCHGPVGSTLAFRELYEITGEEIYRNWTIELSRGIVRAGAPEKHSWGFWNCQCQGAVEQQVFWSILLPCMNIPERKSSMIYDPYG